MMCCNCSNKEMIGSDVLTSAKVFVLASSRERFTAAEVCSPSSACILL